MSINEEDIKKEERQVDEKTMVEMRLKVNKINEKILKSGAKYTMISEGHKMQVAPLHISTSKW